MIVKGRDADRFTAGPPPDVIAALFFGPDTGLVHERAVKLAKSAVPDLSDPFRVTELDETVLGSDPARLWDEASALSMTGGRRVVRVRGADNGDAKIFERFLDAPPGDALIVVEGGDLSKSSALRRVFENAENAAAIGCYPDGEDTLESLLRNEMKAAGLSISAEALTYAAGRLGSDRGVTRSEIEKLVLYTMGEKAVTIAHIDAVMGDESELRIDSALDAAGCGDNETLDRELTRLWAAGTSPVGALRQAMAHFQRVMAVRAEKDAARDIASAMRKLRPPVHFSREDAFKRQIAIWTIPKLEEALSHLYEAEALAKTTAVPSETAAERALLSVAVMARTRR